MNNIINARGPEDSPILFIGHSLPTNVENLKEVLDRSHPVYRSLVLPIKYYLNDYLISNYKLRLPSESSNDIFRYINAGTAIDKGKKKILQIAEEQVLREINKGDYRLIFCMGQETIFGIEDLFNKHKIRFRKALIMNLIDSNITIKEMGQYFKQAVEKFKPGDTVLLPIPHNVVSAAIFDGGYIASGSDVATE